MKSSNRILEKREPILIGLILFFLVIMTIAMPRFIKPSNLANVLKDSSILVMVACGQFLVILTGGIDLSVGSNIAFSGMAASLINMNNPDTSPWIVLLIGMAIGLVLGMLNGSLVAFGKVPAIIATLGTMSVYRGFTFVISKGQWVTAHEMTDSFMNLPHGDMLGVPNLIWFAVASSALFYNFMRYTRSGREIYAIGGNRSAAVLVGVRETKVQFLIFSISGLVSGLAGVLWAARYAAAVNEMATGFELQTVAACVIGGVSVAGGSGSVTGVILGALFMGLLNNSMTMIRNMAFFQMLVQGLIVIAAMTFNVVMERRREALLLNRRLA
ncbi:MAG: ABC transporter permease [Spirochaetaceae bacterium]|nr:ABC transporter permease [Spirochaetaceae bacterium]